MINSIDIEQTKQMLISVADAIIENEPLLTEVDSKIGDGDHGIGMGLGMKNAKEKLEATATYESINDIFKDVGSSIMNHIGGASGVIFGTMFSQGARDLEKESTLTAKIFSDMMDKSLKKIKERGKANVGDKTMVDALQPAVIAMQNSDSEDLLVVLDLATKAAEEGVENTKNCVAKFGRAKSLMERAVGFQDAGATSVFIIFSSMLKYLKSI